jgi:hypothetical protein
MNICYLGNQGKYCYKCSHSKLMNIGHLGNHDIPCNDITIATIRTLVSLEKKVSVKMMMTLVAQVVIS